MSERNIDAIAAKLGDSSLGMIPGPFFTSCHIMQRNNHGIRGICLLTGVGRSQGETEHRYGTARQHRSALQWTIIFNISQKACARVHETIGRTAGLYEHIMGAGTVTLMIQA